MNKNWISGFNLSTTIAICKRCNEKFKTEGPFCLDICKLCWNEADTKFVMENFGDAMNRYRRYRKNT
ncbi:MAG: hypothetical protein AABY07_09340 [Nanoarchaeota archaeon]